MSVRSWDLSTFSLPLVAAQNSCTSLRVAGRSSASSTCNTVSSACWWLGGGGASGEVDGAHGPGALEVEEVGGEGLAAEIVNEGEAGQDIE